MNIDQLAQRFIKHPYATLKQIKKPHREDLRQTLSHDHYTIADEITKWFVNHKLRRKKPILANRLYHTNRESTHGAAHRESQEE
jgi:hypothetical protein